jgi:hypothetical protein
MGNGRIRVDSSMESKGNFGRLVLRIGTLAGSPEGIGGAWVLTSR